MKIKSLKGLQNQVDTKKGQKLNHKQLSQVSGGIIRRTHLQDTIAASYEDVILEDLEM